MGEVQEEPGHVHHAGGFVHDNQTAGSHHGAGADQGVIVNGQIKLLRGQTAAGRTAALYRFELLAVLNAAGNIEHDFPQGNAHGHFRQTGFVDFACQAEYLAAFALFGAHGRVPVGAAPQNERYVGIGFDVVQTGRFQPQSGVGRERRTNPRHAPLAFDGVDQRGFFAANEGAGAGFNAHFEIETGSHDVFAHDAKFFALLNGHVQTFDGQGIFRPAVNYALIRANGVGGDHHAFHYRMGVALQYAAVHEGTGVAFVGVANDIFLIACGIAHKLPFHAGGETAAAPAAQTGFLNFVDNRLGIHGQCFLQSFVTAGGQIVFNAFRIGPAQTGGYGTHLLFIVRRLFHHVDAFIRGVVAGNLNFRHFCYRSAVNQMAFDNFADIVGIYAAVHNAGFAGQGHFNYRLRIAHADTAGNIDIHVQTAFGHVFFDGFHDFFPAGGDTASTQTDNDTGFI